MIDAMWYETNILGYSTDKTYITQYTIDYLYDIAITFILIKCLIEYWIE